MTKESFMKLRIDYKIDVDEDDYKELFDLIYRTMKDSHNKGK